MKSELISKTMNKEHCDIYYWLKLSKQGEAYPWLVFLNGAGADHQMFLEQLDVVSDKYNLLLWDARGHGRSRYMVGGEFSIKICVDDLVEILNREGIESATFIGQSMGGNIVQEFNFLYSQRVEKLVLIDCTCNTARLSTLENAVLKITPLLVRMYPWKSLVRSSVKASSLRPDVQRYLTTTFNNMGKEFFTKVLLATAACLHYEEGYRINKPMLLVYGEMDETGNIKKIAPTWAANEPFCMLVEIPEASHCANQDNPQAFNQALVQFLDADTGT